MRARPCYRLAAGNIRSADLQFGRRASLSRFIVCCGRALAPAAAAASATHGTLLTLLPAAAAAEPCGSSLCRSTVSRTYHPLRWPPACRLLWAPHRLRASRCARARSLPLGPSKAGPSVMDCLSWVRSWTAHRGVALPPFYRGYIRPAAATPCRRLVRPALRAYLSWLPLRGSRE